MLLVPSISSLWYSFHLIIFDFQETFESRERKRQASNLLHMDPQGQMGMGMGMVGHGYI